MPPVNSRRTFAALVLALFAVTVSFIAPSGVAGVSADPIDDKRNEAKQVADKLHELETQAELLTEEYNDALLKQQELQGQIDAATTRVNEADAEVTKRRLAMKDFAVGAYVRGGAEVAVPSPLQHDLNTSAKLEQYADAAVGDPVKLIKQFRAAKAEAEKQVKELDDAKAEADKVSNAVGEKMGSAKAAVDEQLKLHNSLQGDLSLLVAAERNSRTGGTIPTGGGTGKPAPPIGSGAGDAISAAKSQLGTPYKWAGASPSTGFDCSGFVMWAWQHGGKSLPHSSRSMYNMSTKIPMSAIQPGDLVFYGSPVHHVALYIGGGQIIHSPSSGDVVKISNVNYWDALVGAGRI